jgi:hypothetical protein
VIGVAEQHQDARVVKVSVMHGQQQPELLELLQRNTYCDRSLVLTAFFP